MQKYHDTLTETLGNGLVYINLIMMVLFAWLSGYYAYHQDYGSAFIAGCGLTLEAYLWGGILLNRFRLQSA